jgi:predicted dehydrogenase
MKTLNVAIIGQGRSGRDIHGAYFHTDKERFKVVAVVESLEDRRKRAAEEFKCDIYESYQELFGRTDIDLVVNASYSFEHAPITIAMAKIKIKYSIFFTFLNLSTNFFIENSLSIASPPILIIA